MNFRLLVAFVLSTVVTASVAAPLAFRVQAVRDEQALSGVDLEGDEPLLVDRSDARPDASVSSEGLTVSFDRAVAASFDLANSEIFGEVFLFFDDAADTITYWIDDPTRSGPPAFTTSEEPFFFTGGAFDVGDLTVGSHELTAEIRSGADTLIRSATFTVTGG